VADLKQQVPECTIAPDLSSKSVTYVRNKSISPSDAVQRIAELISGSSESFIPLRALESATLLTRAQLIQLRDDVASALSALEGCSLQLTSRIDLNPPAWEVVEN